MINLEKYRDKWLAQNVDDFIGFYTREFYCLDNFSAFQVEYEGITYSTIEHAYQSLKYKDNYPEIQKQIIEAKSPYEAKKIADLNKDKLPKDWHEHKVDLMHDLLKAKLDQHEYVKEKLIQTQDYLICEDSPVDSFWGIGPNKDGENVMGKLWMRLRDSISKTEKNMKKSELNKVQIYTDGACSGNPGLGGWGAILF